MCYRGFIKRLLDLIWITETLFMTNQITSHLKTKMENIQYESCIAITGAIRGTSREHSYHELGLKSLGDQRWCRKLTFFYKIMNELAPKYVANIYMLMIIRLTKQEHQNIAMQKRFGTRTEIFRQSFFPFCVNEWCKLDIL